MQMKLGLLGEISLEIRDLDWEHVGMCESEQASMRLCVRHSRVYRSQEDLAECLGMTKGALNTILNSDHNDRPRHMSRVKQVDLQRLCGNRAIDQWAELYAKGLLRVQKTKTQREAELLAELEQLRSQA